MKLTAIILTLNEEKHLSRCLASLNSVADNILVADSYSTDRTTDIARHYGARVVQNPFVNQSVQFNWALNQIDKDTDWVLRIDADEYLTPELAKEIGEKLPNINDDINGIYCGRYICFQGKVIRHGGQFPIYVLRIFRYGQGKCENRWMDEHIVVQGTTTRFEGNIIDHNLNSISWWTAKHNGYASREALEMLNLKYGFLLYNDNKKLDSESQAGIKRLLKESMYARLPEGFRAFAYFFYRYVVRFGFLDGQEGTTFHVLQGFWYRYLVDKKVSEVEKYVVKHNCKLEYAIEKVLDIKLDL